MFGLAVGLVAMLYAMLYAMLKLDSGAYDLGKSLGAAADWGDPRLKSSGLQPPILKSLKSMPWHTFKAPETNRVKSVKSGRFS